MLPCSGRLWTIAFCTRFVVSCSRSAYEPMVGGHVAGGLDGEAAFFCAGEERFGGFFRYEGQKRLGSSAAARKTPLVRGDLPAGTVTFLFTDVEGSTKLLHELGTEA